MAEVSSHLPSPDGLPNAVLQGISAYLAGRYVPTYGRRLLRGNHANHPADRSLHRHGNRHRRQFRDTGDHGQPVAFIIGFALIAILTSGSSSAGPIDLRQRTTAGIQGTSHNTAM